MNFGTGDKAQAKAWRDIWGSGQGIGAVDRKMGAGEYVERLVREYEEARSGLIGLSSSYVRERVSQAS
jgi:nitronate monooxygenase